jgi:hypothetical protein
VSTFTTKDFSALCNLPSDVTSDISFRLTIEVTGPSNLKIVSLTASSLAPDAVFGSSDQVMQQCKTNLHQFIIRIQIRRHNI